MSTWTTALPALSRKSPRLDAQAHVLPACPQVRTDSCQDGQAQQLVAQKYLERPLLAFQRKFDLRQWVLVSSWEPLTVWFYDQCYLRFCAEDYKASNFDNIFCHLSNNSIAKKSRKFNSGVLRTRPALRIQINLGYMGCTSRQG